MTLYAENQRLHRKTARLINSVVTGYKINVQKSVAFLYTNIEAVEREIKKPIPFIIALRITKYLEINLTKGGERTVLWKL